MTIRISSLSKYINKEDKGLLEQCCNDIQNLLDLYERQGFIKSVEDFNCAARDVIERMRKWQINRV